jgi:hypothetical protein
METGAVVENASLFDIDQNRRLYEFYVGWYLKGLPPGINHGGRALGSGWPVSGSGCGSDPVSHAGRAAAAGFGQTGRGASPIVLALTACMALPVWATGSEDAVDTIKQQLTATVAEWNGAISKGSSHPMRRRAPFMTPEGPIRDSAVA